MIIFEKYTCTSLQNLITSRNVIVEHAKLVLLCIVKGR